MAFNHFSIVTMTKSGPSIANLKLGGVLNKYGNIPANWEKICFEAHSCKTEQKSVK
ncbi:MAG: hypothetical protein V3V00_01915 [Saprospiraceae bacterium]